MFDPEARSDRHGESSPETLTIQIATSHPLLLEGLAFVLARLAPRVNIQHAGTLQCLLAALAERPDTALVLLDLIEAEGGGTTAIAHVRTAYPAIPVVAVSGTTDPATIIAAIRCGAMGYISQRSTPNVLLGALRLVLAGEVYVPPAVLREPFAMEPADVSTRVIGPAREAIAPDLTTRQLEVLALLVQGKSNKVISRELGLAQGTVKAHTAAIFRALRVSNRTEAAFVVRGLGIEVPARGEI
jgi:DNA-binding NarL/FixJ family response regulator